MSKLRILCLHGLAQNKTMFMKKTAALMRSVEDSVDLVYVTGPLAVLTPEYSSISMREQSANTEISEENKPYAWWYPQRYKPLLADGTMPGVGESLEFIKTVLIEQGPFDGILGFSQGGCFSACLSVLLEDRSILPDIIPPEFAHPPLKFVIVVAGYIPSEEQGLSSLFSRSSKLKTSSLHIIGDLDTLLSPKEMLQLAGCYENPVVLRHPGGHFVPSISSVKKRLVSFISSFSQLP
ncbi:serine hydrolase FSH [Absidia repens]|uniref:Serine hydrolase FSH n=1 Tax=Absidia repens TaxID=90262 RepID=A0A1X2ITW7_9FUNG|nr:serine hydrolase FSH [Absidia repens]